MGQVLQAGVGQAPARKAALLAGLPETTSATTINRVCGSGLKSIMLAAAEIKAGDAEVVVAGGMESMNLAPYLLPKARFGYRLGHAQLLDATIQDGLWCTIEDCHMGTHAERVAIKESVSREAQDRFALTSHQRAIAAHGRRPIRRRDGAGDDQGPEGRDRRRHRRGPAARHQPSRRSPGSSRSSSCRPATTAATRRTAPSPPATRRASPTAPRRRSSPASAPSSSSA